MKKTLEIIIVLGMFYGIWSLFDRIAILFWNNPSVTVVVFSALITSILLVYLYSLAIGNDATNRSQQRVNELTDLLTKKEQELNEVFSLKKNIMKESQEYLTNDTQ